MAFRITSITAFIAVGEDDEEGIIGAPIGPNRGWIPLIAADDDRMQSLIPLATEIAKSTNVRIKLIRFTHREEVCDIPGFSGGQDKDEQEDR
jgi:hypothetical protein